MNSTLTASMAPPSRDWSALAESDFVMPLQQRHLCQLCHALLKDPLQLSCGDLFCRLCVEPHLTNDAPLVCPNCDEELDPACPAFPDNSAKKEILTKLKVYCRNKSAGCPATLCLRDKEDHETGSCDFAVRECRFREWGCDAEPPERDKETHYAQCRFRPVECPHCQMTVAECRLEDDHLKNVCEKVKLDCPFDCGRRGFIRAELKEHKSLCPLRTAPCPFKDVGCSYEGTVDGIAEHQAGSNCDHLSLNYSKTLSLDGVQTEMKGEISQLAAENEELKKTLEEQGAVFKANVEDLKRQLSDLADKMHTVENEVYRLSNCVVTTSPAATASAASLSTSPNAAALSSTTTAAAATPVNSSSSSSSTPINSSSSTTTAGVPSSSTSSHPGVTAHQTVEAQMTEESARRMAKLDQSSVSANVHEMKREMKRMAKKLSELESNQSRSSLNRLNNGSEVSLASSIASNKSEPSLDRKVTLHDQWLKDLDLRLQISDTATYDGILIWKITEYTRRKRNADNGSALSLYSQPFYTSKYGYKMCCRVYLNGDGLGKGSHLSLFFSIMKGEYDSLLRWPFRQKVTLMLLDQGTAGSPGIKHLVDSFRPDPKSNSFQRPTTEMNIASGCPLFVSQSVVDEGSLYKKDDTIYIKCVVEATN